MHTKHPVTVVELDEDRGGRLFESLSRRDRTRTYLDCAVMTDSTDPATFALAQRDAVETGAVEGVVVEKTTGRDGQRIVRVAVSGDRYELYVLGRPDGD